MSLINNPYCQVDPYLVRYQNETNDEAVKSIIYDFVNDYAEMYNVIDIEDITEQLESVDIDEVEEAVRKWRMIHDWA